MVVVPHGTIRVGWVPPVFRSVGAKGAPKVKWLNRYKSADCPIWLKLCLMTHTKVPEGRPAITLELEVEFLLK